MRHYVLTRSAYGPAWDRAANRRRLDITRAVTVRLMLAQQPCDWTWIVLLDERDPFLAERRALYASAAPAFVPIVWSPPEDPAIAALEVRRQRAAAAEYKAPWRAAIGPSDDLILTTRLDDDDGLAPDALVRYQAAARGLRRRTVLMLPNGFRVWAGSFSTVRHDRNAMHTLVAPPGDELLVYDYGHTTVRAVAPVVEVDARTGWLWVRHRDTISGWRRADRRITPAVRRLFPIDWDVLSTSWRAVA